MNSTSAETPRHLYVKRKGEKLYRLFLIILCFGLGVFYHWKYYLTYREGYRAGFLQKLSQKGTIFITHEFEMVVDSVAVITDVVTASRKFFFSVTNKNLAKKLDNARGQKVMVHYKQKNGTIFSAGEATYLVIDAKVIA